LSSRCSLPGQGGKRGSWGRKPLLLVAFGALPVRGVLYTLTVNTGALVAIQILDGVAAGIFGVVSVLVIADLTQGTGRLISPSGPSARRSALALPCSQVIAGSIVHHFGSNAGFLFLAVVASAAFGILYFFMAPVFGGAHRTPDFQFDGMLTAVVHQGDRFTASSFPSRKS
jgi:predicted MFS family arabinose efflux permease